MTYAASRPVHQCCPRRSCRQRRQRRQRGVGLFDALIALALLSFGLLGMTKFQGRMVTQATESQTRQVATQLASEQISTVLVDAANAACYTLPRQGVCTNSAAATATSAWAARAAATLPKPVTTVAVLDATSGLLTLTITWTTKAQSDLSAADAVRTLTAMTDVRSN